MYILYFIRIFYKSAKVILLQLIFKGLQFVKRLADVLQINISGVFSAIIAYHFAAMSLSNFISIIRHSLR